MQNNTYPGKFIVFEGLDGSGQTTQAKLLKDFLFEKDKGVLLTKEPTLRSDAGKYLKELLNKKAQVSPQEFQELFAKDREEHLKKDIIPALEKNVWVISDRYFFTSFAYGAAEGVDVEYLISINNDFLLPDITFFLKVNPEVCLKRIQQRGEPLAYFETKEHFEKAWKVFEDLSKRFEHVYVVDGEQPIEKVAEDIKEILKV